MSDHFYLVTFMTQGSPEVPVDVGAFWEIA